MTSSGEPSADDKWATLRDNPQYRDVVLALDARKLLVSKMTAHARAKMLDVSEELVNRHYKWFWRWYEGHLATGYLVNRLGLKRIGGDK